MLDSASASADVSMFSLEEDMLDSMFSSADSMLFSMFIVSGDGISSSSSRPCMSSPEFITELFSTGGLTVSSSKPDSSSIPIVFSLDDSAGVSAALNSRFASGDSTIEMLFVGDSSSSDGISSSSSSAASSSASTTGSIICSLKEKRTTLSTFSGSALCTSRRSIMM